MISGTESSSTTGGALGSQLRTPTAKPAGAGQENSAPLHLAGVRHNRRMQSVPDHADLTELAPPHDLPGSSPVTLALLDGSRRKGRIARFSATNTTLMLEPEGTVRGESDKLLLRAEDVAYVG